jgi:hypothetical protein
MSEEVQKDEGSQKGTGKTPTIPINPYSNLSRELSQEDLASPAVQRILLSEVDKLENKNLLLEGNLKTKTNEFILLQEKFHLMDKTKGILEEKQKKSTSQEVLYSFCLAAGSATIGFAKIVWEDHGPMFLLLGIFLIIGGIISKAIKWI